jgi:hypothetical protein
MQVQITDFINVYYYTSLLLTSAPHTPNQDLNHICGHNLPMIRFYDNDMLLYCILSFNIFITLADKTCKLPEDGVRTPKAVRVILILIL